MPRKSKRRPRSKSPGSKPRQEQRVPVHDGAPTYTINWQPTGSPVGSPLAAHWAVRVVNQSTRQAFEFNAQQVFYDQECEAPTKSSCLFQLAGQSGTPVPQYIFVGNRILRFSTKGGDVITDFYSFKETNAIAVGGRYAYALAEWEDIVALSLEVGDFIVFKQSSYRDAWGELLATRDDMRGTKVRQATIDEFSP